MTCIIGKITAIRPSTMRINKITVPRLYSSLWTPDYLEAMKPKIPQYPVLNIQIKSYDFPVLEKYQGLISKLADRLDIDVDNSYALPSKHYKIQRFKPQSTASQAEYVLNIYERNTQISNVSSVRFPIFLRMIEAALPEDVMLNIEEWNPEKEELRYIPDKQLLDLKTELESMQKK